MQHIDKVAVLEAVAAAWNRAGITYAVAHGIGGYPATVGRDLDVLVRADQVTAGLTIAERVLDLHGFTVVRPPPLWGARLLAVHNADWDIAIEIHTLTQLSWRNVVLADEPRPCERRGPFQVDPWVSFSKRILHPLLGGDTRRYAERPHEWALHSGEHDAVLPVLSSLCGAELAQRLYQALVVGDPSLAAPLVPRLKRAFMRHAWAKAPATSLRLLGNVVRKRLVRPWAPCAPVVALVGPDGVGKSTILRDVSTGWDPSLFLNVVVRHLRPGVLPGLGSLADKRVLVPGLDGPLSLRRAAGRFHRLRLYYYLLDYVVGHIIKDRIESSIQRLVLYERYALDMIVNPPRFGLRWGRATWPLERFSPQPDLVVLLYDTPERIRARKPELTLPDIQQQLQHWLRFADDGKIDAVVSVDAPSEQVSERIKALIVGALIAKNGGPAPRTASSGHR